MREAGVVIAELDPSHFEIPPLLRNGAIWQP
jgi:hypothetical protein